MAERWFRFYDGVPDDPKAQRLSDALFRAWVNLLCLSSRYGGEIPKDHSLIAFALRLTISKIDAIMFALVSATLFDKTETGYRPHNWNGRQYKSDVSSDRVKQFRERQRNVSSAVSATPPEDRVQNTDTEKKVERAKRATPSNSKGTRWPPDKLVSLDWIENAREKRAEHGLPGIDLILEGEKFANYWASKSGRDATKLDWHATWNNWALRSTENRYSGKVSAHDKGTQGAALFLAELERSNGAGHRDRAGEAGSSPRLLAPGHGLPQVGDAVPDVLRGSPGPERGTASSRVPGVAEQRGEHEIPDAGPTQGGVRPVQNVIESARAGYVPRGARGTRTGSV